MRAGSHNTGECDGYVSITLSGRTGAYRFREHPGRNTMSIATAEGLHIVHALPGRIRLNIPWWNGGNCFALEERIRQLPGIQKVQANELTHNVLIGYDSQKTDQQAILSTLETLDPSSLETKQGQKTTHTSSPIHQEKNATWCEPLFLYVAWNAIQP